MHRSATEGAQACSNQCMSSIPEMGDVKSVLLLVNATNSCIYPKSFKLDLVCIVAT